MERGLIISFEGTDGSGKETQSKRVNKYLNENNFLSQWETFPMYHRPFGRMVGGPFLGKPDICDSYFEEPSKMDPIAASMIYCAERRHELPLLENIVNSGKNLILDRYVGSNMGMQGGKIRDAEKRIEFYKFLEHLEYDMAKLPRPDITFFLYMPQRVASELQSRNNKPKDRVEKDANYLKNSVEAYLQLAEYMDWKKIDCCPDGTINTLKTPEKITEEIVDYLKNIL